MAASKQALPKVVSRDEWEAALNELLLGRTGKRVAMVSDAMTHPAHLHARDTSLVMVSRAPLEKLKRYQSREGWPQTAPYEWNRRHDECGERYE